MRICLNLCICLIFCFTQLHSYAQTADFSSDTTKGCAPLSIQFKDLSSGTGLKYRWDFGNGNYSSLQNPQAIFYQSGVYTVSLTVTDGAGTKNTLTKSAYITVFKGPEAQFSSPDLKGCMPHQARFKEKSKLGDAPISSWIWDFGDGNTFKDSNAVHTYTVTGKFNVSLLVRDANQCESQLIKPNYIEVEPSPVIHISADKRYYCESPVDIQFTDLSTRVSSGDSYYWEFGDGSSSNQKDPLHTYTKNGTYTVRLTITKANGCATTRVFTDYIHISPLNPDFIADKTQQCAPSTIKFTNITSPTTNGLSFRWDFGDGSAMGGVNTQHEYSSPGVYTVKLTATVDENCKYTTEKQNYIRIEDGPHASFTVSDSLSCKLPLTVLLNSTSTNTNAVEWFLGKNSIGNYFNTGTVLQEFGVYKVSLIAQNSLGCKDTAWKNIKIGPIDLELDADVKQGCLPLEVNFSGSTAYSDSILSYDWDFGDGNSLTDGLINSSHTFTKIGNFTVTLKMTTASGCVSFANVVIKVGDKTNPSFILGTENVCNHYKINFINETDLNNPKLDSNLWYIGNPGNWNLFDDKKYHGSSEIDMDSGWYDIMLITVNNGCRDTFIGDKQLFVQPPNSEIRAEETELCTTKPFKLFNESTGADSSVWHVYSPTAGLRLVSTDSLIILDTSYQFHHVYLISWNFRYGCIDTAEYAVVFPTNTTTAAFTHSDNLCAPADVLFIAIGSTADHYYTWYLPDTSFSGPSLTYLFETAGTYPVKLVVESKTSMCIDSTEKQLMVTGPTVNGKIKGTEGCSPVDILLTSYSDPDDYAELYWLIDTFRINVSDTGTITHTLLKPGNGKNGEYVIKLIGKDSAGCTGSQSFNFIVDGVLNAYIKVRRFSNCKGNEFIFQLEAPGYNLNTLDLEWDFDDGSYGSKISEYHILPESGNFNITLSITEPNGCVTVLNQPISIAHEKLFASFDADSLQTACPPLFVQFKDISTATSRRIIKYLWDFGDGSFSEERNPSKLYLKAGKFTVKLTIEDDWGCIDSAVYKDFVIVNGPVGEFNFDKKQGCVPLEVNFSSTNQGADYFEWDMGDGYVIEEKDSLSHTYNEPGRYIPLLILRDTFGCTYTLAPIDTIFVDPYPVPEFDYKGHCFGDEIKFWTIDTLEDVVIDQYEWSFIQSPVIYRLPPSKSNDTVSFRFEASYEPSIKLKVTTARGCQDSIKKTIDLYKLDAQFNALKKYNCVGSNLVLNPLVNSDTTVKSYLWTFPWGTSSEVQPSIIPTDTGKLNIDLVVTDIFGCKDSSKGNYVMIGDTISPPDLEMLRVSVLDDVQIELDHKRSSLADFDAYLIYQDVGGQYVLIHEEKNRDATHFVHTGNDTRNSSYCYKIEVRNSCGLMSDTLSIDPHCTVEVGAKGMENAIALRWNAYSGWSDIEAYEIYREKLDATSNYELIGIVDGESLKYIDSTVSCKVLHRYKIKAIERSGNSQWSLSDTAAARPIWINTLKANELIRATVVDDKYISLDWDSVAYHRMPIASYEVEKSIDGFDYIHTQSLEPEVFSTEDLEVAVDDRSYFYRTYAIDVCGDTSPYSNFGKTILLKASTDSTLDQHPVLDWSTYKGWWQEVNYYSIEIENPDGSFSEVGSTFPMDSFLKDDITDLNQRPDYCYRIIGHRNTVGGESEVISISNVDCSPVKSLLWIPNAFSPNGDHLNDKFVTPGIYIKEYHLMIYNRWGELVFESFDYYDNWDGMYQSKPCQQDAYMVIVETVGVDGIRRQHAATVTLVR